MNSTEISPKIYEILAKAVNGTIDNFIVSVHDPNKKGDGFLGQVFFVSLKDKSTGKQLHFVVKQAFAEQSVRDAHHIRDVYLNEIYFYTKVWPAFSKFQKQVPPKNQFNHLAKLVAVIPEENFERLVLENLKYQGFAVHDKKKPLDKGIFEFIFKVYAKFHAISFAYKASDPDGFSELVSGITDTWSTSTQVDNFQDIMKVGYVSSLECLRPGVDDAVIEKYKHYVDDGSQLLTKLLVASGKYNVLIHGDCWSNNMMFKYDNSGKLMDLRLLDFQMPRLASPVSDLAYCLYSGGAKEVFDELDDLLQVYHDSLSETLRAYGRNPDEVYTLQSLKNDWKIYSHVGMTMGFLLWRGKLTHDDDVVDLSDITKADGDMRMFYEANFDKETYAERIRDIIFHCYERGYIV